MPTYEYECKECGHNFEVFQSMSDEPVKHCVKCGKEVRRLIFGGAGIIFKGSGFYVTDKASGNTSGKSAGKTKKTDTKSDAGSGTETASTAPSQTASTENKPADKEKSAGKTA